MMMMYCYPLIAIAILVQTPVARSFVVVPSIPHHHTRTVVVLGMATQEKRQPRRSLKKRNRRRKMVDGIQKQEEDDFPWETAESRPMVQSYAKELGEDYWVDEEELQRSKDRQAALKALEPGQIPKEKLWDEVLSPYRNNWIGWVTVTIFVLVFILQTFPEIISPPLIVNVPDL